MAKYIPMELLSSLHGKVCGHSDVYFVQRGGTRYTGKICHPRSKPFSSSELALQEKFKQTHQATLTALATPTDRAKYEAAFRNQLKYSTLRGYVFATLYAQGA